MLADYHILRCHDLQKERYTEYIFIEIDLHLMRENVKKLQIMLDSPVIV